MFASWRASLHEGLRQGLPARAPPGPRGAAAQAEQYAAARTHDALMGAYGAGPLAGRARRGGADRLCGLRRHGRGYLREDYAPPRH